MKPFMTLHVGKHDTLYVIVDGDKCRQNSHLLIPVTFDVELSSGKSLQMEGHYCFTCRQNQVSRNLFAENRDFHNQILARYLLKGLEDVICEPMPAFDYADFPKRERAAESILKKYGYSVGRDSNLSDAERQEKLQMIIEKKKASKGYVIALLESNIRINGKKESNYCALQKWKRDLEFVKKL